MGNLEMNVKYVHPITGYFEINNGKSTYLLIDKLSHSMYREKLSEFYEKEKQKGNPIPADSRQTFQIMRDARKLNNSSLKNFLYESLSGGDILTLSRIVYNEEGDKILHKYNTSDEFCIEGKFSGRDFWVKNIADKNLLKALLDTDNIENINAIAQYLRKKDFRVWRRFKEDQTPNVERSCVFYANVNEFGLGLINERPDHRCAFLIQQIK